MKNKEFYQKEILDIIIKDDSLAVDITKNTLTSCLNIDCCNCLFQGICRNIELSAQARKEWLEKEHNEYDIDWSKIPVDTPIFVRDLEYEEWLPRYFCKYENGQIYAWKSGVTSWSAVSNNDHCRWKEAILAPKNE